MVYLEKKKISGNTYLYLVISTKINGKTKRVWQKYLGPEKKFMKKAEQIKLQLDDSYDLKTSEFGLEFALFRLAQQLNLVQLIDDNVSKRDQGLSVGQYILIAVLNRCIDAKSKSRLDWWLKKSILKDLLPAIESYLDATAYTNHFQYLTQEILDQIQLQLNDTLRSKFAIKMDQLFYDPTNFYTYINPKHQLLPRHGKSKEGRHTLNLIGLSLLCTRDTGLPILHQVYPGNEQDATHFKIQHKRLLDHIRQQKLNPSEITLVFDKGNISEEGIKGLDGAKMKFICSARPSCHKDLNLLLTTEDFELQTLPNGKEIGVREYKRKFHGTDCRLIVCFNPKRQHFNSVNKLKKIQTKLNSIQEWFAARLNHKKWRSMTEVEKKLRALIGKTYLNYINYQVEGSDGDVNFSVWINDDALAAAVDRLGKTFYMSNDADLEPIEIVWLYRQQYNVERVFNYLKLGNLVPFRPMYHFKDSSIKGHVFSIVLGLLLMLLLHREVIRQFPTVGLAEMLEVFDDIKIVEIYFSNSEVRKKLVTNTKMAKEFVKKLWFFKELPENISR